MRRFSIVITAPDDITAADVEGLVAFLKDGFNPDFQVGEVTDLGEAVEPLRFSSKRPEGY